MIPLEYHYKIRELLWNDEVETKDNRMRAEKFHPIIPFYRNLVRQLLNNQTKNYNYYGSSINALLCS